MYPRSSTSRFLRRFLVTTVIFLINLHVYFLILRKPTAYSPNLDDASSEYGSPPKPIGRVFIASNQWNTARAIRSHWAASLIGLIKALGVQNVYVSIYENGSYDDTKAALAQLDAELERLGVARTILTEENSHSQQLLNKPTEEQEGWIKTPTGTIEKRRIPILAQLRNRVLEPLQVLQAKGKGNFARVLFLNDVIYSVKKTSPLSSFIFMDC